jgi:hypothetical protein
MKFTKMKSINVLAVALIVVVTACSKTSPKKVENVLTEGTWKISYLSDDGEDETYYFTGYAFEFEKDNTVSATGNSTVVNGTWKLEKTSGDDNKKHSELTMDFPVVLNFDELNDDWHVISISEFKIELEDVSGDGSVDRLTFSKL